MILLSKKDNEDILIQIKSAFGVNVSIKMKSGELLTFNNVSLIHWLDPTFHNSVFIECKFFLQTKIIPLDTFYWLSFQTATKIEL